MGLACNVDESAHHGGLFVGCGGVFCDSSRTSLYGFV